MIRVELHVPSMEGKQLAYTDHYVKLLFVPEAAEYELPASIETIRETFPREQWPVTRTYTIRRFNPDTAVMDIDFVTHGDVGLAGPWAAQANKGDVIFFFGPGGAWAPSDEHAHFIFAGDESALPAIAAGLEALPRDASAQAFIEVEDEPHQFEVTPSLLKEEIELTWVHRKGAIPGAQLADAVRAAGVPDKPTAWFVHGVAEMIKDLRQFLFVEQDVDRADVSISGYWRLGMTEDKWQATKRNFVAEMEAKEQA